MTRLISLALAGGLLAVLGACAETRQTQERLGIPGTPATAVSHRGIQAASASRTGPAQVDPASLYSRLGQRAGIEAVVADFTNRMAGDRRVNRRFANTNPQAFIARLTDQICQASGGPCTYTGKDMKTAHAGMRITNREWNITVAHLTAAMRAKRVGLREQREVLAMLGPMRNDIVGQ
jgi:hemoglobin